MHDDKDMRWSLLLPRRALIAGASAAALALPFGRAGFARQATANDLTARAHDWDWLKGNWDVWHRRLKDRLAGSTEWQEFGGKSALWQALAGLATIDDNIVDMPSGSYRGLTVRTFDSTSGLWSIWWLDGRNPTVIDPPVRGRFDGDNAAFVGPDTFKGRPVIVRFRWLDVRSKRPHWEQAMSADAGKSWEVNWENFFTRTSAMAAPLARFSDRNRDFDFLAGRWAVRHRRLKRRLSGSEAWETFIGTLDNLPVLGGWANIGDNVMARANGPTRGIGLRAFDPKAQSWSSWWIDGQNPSIIGPPLRGRFADGAAIFEGDDVQDGRPVRTRVRWSRITSSSARWEQAMSQDGGATWETNWISDLERRA